ncbi:MAG: hypothetical protein HRT37_02570 [Alteromonadaceae bacterium]|nr:hypothetical protein [Alteromonadaceae bacterium]
MEFIFLASDHFLALLSMGPDFFIIIQTVLKKPLRHAFCVSIYPSPFKMQVLIRLKNIFTALLNLK